MEGVEHTTVTTLVTTMSKNHIGLSFRVESASGQSACCHDEAIHENEHFQFGSSEHRTDGGNHLETAKVTDDEMGEG